MVLVITPGSGSIGTCARLEANLATAVLYEPLFPEVVLIWTLTGAVTTGSRWGDDVADQAGDDQQSENTPLHGVDVYEAFLLSLSFLSLSLFPEAILSILLFSLSISTAIINVMNWVDVC